MSNSQGYTVVAAADKSSALLELLSIAVQTVVAPLALHARQYMLLLYSKGPSTQQPGLGDKLTHTYVFCGPLLLRLILRAAVQQCQ